MAQLTLQGKYNTATVYTHNIEETAIGQVIGMLNEVITKKSKNYKKKIIPEKQVLSDFHKRNIMSILNKLL